MFSVEPLLYTDHADTLAFFIQLLLYVLVCDFLLQVAFEVQENRDLLLKALWIVLKVILHYCDVLLFIFFSVFETATAYLNLNKAGVYVAVGSRIIFDESLKTTPQQPFDRM